MWLRRFALAALVASVLAPPAFAQLDDDLLVPLAPSEGKGKVRRKAKPKAPPKPVQADDPLIAPLAAPTELVVTVGESVKGARLFVDERDLGFITGQAVPVSPGDHKISIRRLGFADLSIKVKFDKGERQELDVELEPVSGVLTIQANVPAADVVVDGRPMGKAPLRELLLTPGTHEVRVAKAGYLTDVAKLSIRAGKDYTLNSLLKPGTDPVMPDRPELSKLTPGTNVAGNPGMGTAAGGATVAGATPWFGLWYVWAGAAALVAAAAGGTYVVLQPKPLLPSTVCGGPCDATINYSGAVVIRAGGAF